MRCRVSLTVLLCVFAGAATCRAEERGTGLAFLRIGVGARAAGLGNAYVSGVDDGTATYWNPAGLARVRTLDISLMHNEYFQDVRYEFLGFGRRIGAHAVGASVAGLYTGSEAMERRDEFGNFEGHFGSYDFAASLGYAYRFGEDLSAGLTVKYLTENIDRTNASGFAADAGIQWDTPVDHLRIGAVVQNVGPSMKFIDDEFDLPTTVQGGARYAVPMAAGEFMVVAEVRKVRGDDAGLDLGTSYEYREMAALRFGYKSGLDSEDVSFGLGFRKHRVRLDYAFVPYGNDLGDTHRVGLGYSY
jgi:hypothetical protein